MLHSADLLCQTSFNFNPSFLLLFQPSFLLLRIIKLPVFD